MITSVHPPSQVLARHFNPRPIDPTDSTPVMLALGELGQELRDEINPGQPSHLGLPFMLALTGSLTPQAYQQPTPNVPKSTPPVVTPPGGGAGGFLNGLAAALLGAYVGWNLQDWIPRELHHRKPPKPFDENGCRPEDLAESYLSNLQRNQVDERLKSIPPRSFKWDMPNGYGIEVKQGWSKYGLTYQLKLKAPDGSFVTENVDMKFEATQKGVTVPVLETPLVVKGENFGKLNLNLRVNSRGLDELGLTFTSHEGYVTKFKLKPGKLCGLDVTTGQLLRMNQGYQADAQKWVEIYLAKSAAQNKHNLYPGLIDLLVYMQPSASGVYRNHGSTALSVLTTALNQLKQAGVDFSKLHRLQKLGQEAAYGSADYKQYRRQIEQWFQSELNQAIGQGKVDPATLRNPYQINFGLDAIKNANERRTATAPLSTVQIQPAKPQIEITFQDVQQAATGRVVQQTRDGGLFVAMPFVVDFKSNPTVIELIDRLAKALGVQPDQIKWYPAKLTLRGVQASGILIKAHAQ